MELASKVSLLFSIPLVVGDWYAGILTARIQQRSNILFFVLSGCVLANEKIKIYMVNTLMTD